MFSLPALVSITPLSPLTVRGVGSTRGRVVLRIGMSFWFGDRSRDGSSDGVTG
jgi:hypothetical protein